MRWDRKIFLAAALVTLTLLAGILLMALVTGGRIHHSSERIELRAQEGCESFLARAVLPGGVRLTRISKADRYEDQEKYAAFDAGWFREAAYAGAEFLTEELSYSHKLVLTLTSYDTENTYSAADAPILYSRFTDTATLFRSGELFYVLYEEAGVEYRFVLTCPPLCEWLDEVK